MHQKLNKILNISSENKFINYIINRVQKESYRGIHVSQHNRYTLEKALTILNTINKHVNSNQFEIPRGDYSEKLKGKKAYDINDFPIYKSMVQSLKGTKNQVSYNSLKKNLFVDFDRMGLINRYKKDGSIVEKEKRSTIYYISLSDLGIKLLNSKNIIDKHRIFTDALDNIFDQYVSYWMEIIYNSDYNDARISIYEFMFIFTDDKIDNHIDLLDSYRSLSRHQKNKFIEYIQEYADPNNFVGDKTQKRDFHNWKNESQQMFRLLKQTSFFQVSRNNDYISLNIGGYGIFESPIIKRSASIKAKYFEKYNIQKIDGFELHHIVPISMARNKKEIEMLDNVYNLIYLDKNKHLEITKKRNKNVILNINPKIAKFFDFENNVINACNGVNANYPKQQEVLKKLLDYNELTIEKVYDLKDIELNRIKELHKQQFSLND